MQRAPVQRVVLQRVIFQRVSARLQTATCGSLCLLPRHHNATRVVGEIN